MSLPFESAYRHGFARVAACTIPIAIADPAANAEAVLAAARECDADAVAVAVFPELCLTGLLDRRPRDAGCRARRRRDGDRAAGRGIRGSLPVLVVGAPLRHRNRLYNCAVVIHRGELLGVAPKSYLPTYREFYERRWYAPGDDQAGEDIRVGELEAPFGPDLLFEALDVPGLVVHAEVCEDVWVPIPPSSQAALAGATVLLNLSGSPITIARAEDRKDLCQSQSLRCLAAYAYAAAGMGESTNDLSWDGQTMIYEGGTLLAETERFPDGAAPLASPTSTSTGSVRIASARARSTTTAAPARRRDVPHRALRARAARARHRTAPHARPLPVRARRPGAARPGLLRGVQHPGVGARAAHGGDRRPEARHRRERRPRLDARAARGRARHGPDGPAAQRHPRLHDARASRRPSTRSRTRSRSPSRSARRSRRSTSGPPRPSCSRASGIRSPTASRCYDITFENVQAGVRTDFLFRLANQHGGMVIGTSDLSELALGWATYGVGDQMSHYAVNTGVPEDPHPARHPLGDLAPRGRRRRRGRGAAVGARHRDQPRARAGRPGRQRSQSTEDRIGPYALHDFALFHVLRYGFRPSKIAFLAAHAWADTDAGAWPPGFPADDRYAYDLPTVVKWLQVFLQPLLRVRAVQALGDPERTEGVAGGLALAARRLARAVGRQRRGLARRAEGRAARARRGRYAIRRRPRGDHVRR